MWVKPPMWFLRMLVRRRPWLLTPHGTVTEAMTISFLIGEFTVSARFSLREEDRLKLLAEREANPSGPGAGGLDRE